VDFISGGLAPWAFWLAVGITLGAGFVKGVSGFAMPMLMISSLVTFLPPTTALAILIMPTFLTNMTQALRQGHALGKQVVPTRQFDQKVHIAVRGLFPSGHRAKNAQTSCTVLRSDAVQAGVHLAKLVKQHGVFFEKRSILVPCTT
jgi:hypothetical protein